MDAVWHDRKLAPRFIVSDDAVLLREWKHGPDTYLLMTSRAATPTATPLSIRVRGTCRIEDYLFGRDVDARVEGGYTTFTTLMANGGRVFRIPGGSPADATAATGTQPETFAATDGASRPDTTITLPFDGRVYAHTALRWGEYTFSNSTIASGIDADQGETYLIVSNGSERQKKRIVAGGDYDFRMRDATFRVHCRANFYKFPFHSQLSVTEAKGTPPLPGCTLAASATSLAVSSGLLQISLDAGRGGRIEAIRLTDDQINQVASHGALSACTENVGRVPGPFVDQPFTTTVVTESEDEVVLELVNARPVDRKTLHKALTLRRGVAGFRYALRCTNLDDRTVQPPFELRWHPELAIGGLADEPDVFIIPTPEGIREVPYRASQGGLSFAPGADWAAVVDRHERLAYVTTFPPEQVGRVYLWQDAQFYDLEIFSPRRQVRTGDSIDLDLGVYLLRGLGGLDAYRDGRGIHAAVPESVDQRGPVRVVLEVGSAYAEIRPVTVSANLRQGNRTLTDFGGLHADTVSFDQPVRQVVEADLKACLDGVYQVHVTAEIAGGPTLTVVKSVRLSGTERAEHLRYYETCRGVLEAFAGTAAADSEAAVFDLRVSLEEFRGEIAAGRLGAASARRRKLAAAVAQLTRRVDRD